MANSRDSRVALFIGVASLLVTVVGVAWTMWVDSHTEAAVRVVEKHYLPVPETAAEELPAPVDGSGAQTPITKEVPSPSASKVPATQPTARSSAPAAFSSAPVEEPLTEPQGDARKGFAFSEKPTAQ